MTKVPTEVTDAVRAGREIEDPNFNALSKLTWALTVTHGNVSQKKIDAFLTVGYTESHVLGIITNIAVKTMSNYSNHITHPEVDIQFSSRVWKKQ